MFIGHYSVSFALKAVRPRTPLWLLFLAVQAVDIGWALLVLAGVERARVVPGFSAAFPIDLYYMPYTHSLAASLVWAAALGALYGLWRRGDGRGGALVLALAVASHWFLDLLVHVPDLPLYGDAHKVGLGLWNYPLVALALELGLLAAGVALYARTRPANARSAWRYAALLALVQAAATLGPWLLPNERAIAVFLLLAYGSFALLAARVDRRRWWAG
jgi:hypothetical protein